MGLTNLTNGPGMPPQGPPGGMLPPNVSPVHPSVGGSAPTTTDAPDVLLNWNEQFRNADPVMFREELMTRLVSVLISHGKPNAVLVGSAGVGKTAIVENLARRLATGDPLIPPQLSGFTVYELPITQLTAGTGIVGTLETKMSELLDFARDPANKVILFIDEIHQITGGSSTHSSTELRKISQILKPYLARGDLRVIGATTSNEAHGFDTDPAFSRRFTRLVVDELTPGQTHTVLEKLYPTLRGHYRDKVLVSDDVLAETIRIADANARAGEHRPDNAITLLDKAMADRQLEQQRLIAEATANGDLVLAKALSTPVPLTCDRVREVARRLMTGNAVQPALDADALHATLSDALLGQGDVIDTLIDQLRRDDLGLFTSNRPRAWLFAGASGVGKTAGARIIAEQVTGSEPIVLNMTEYHSPSAISRIIGASPGYIGSDSQAELPFDTLESNPYRLILLDEFEKADKAVQRLFLSILDEGYLRNARGKRLNFSKSIVVATTNAARESLTGSRVGFGGTEKVSYASLTHALEQFFDTELLTRFSLVVGFNPIDRDTYRRVLTAEYDRQLTAVRDVRPRLADHLPGRLPDDVLGELTGTYVESQGARPAQRAVRAWIEHQLGRVLAAQTSGVAPNDAAPVTPGA